MSRQTLVMITAGSAQAVLAVQPGAFAMPMAWRNWLIGPLVGSKSMFQTIAIATSEVMYGKKIATRKNAIPRSFWFSRSARPSESARVSGTWPIA